MVQAGCNRFEPFMFFSSLHLGHIEGPRWLDRARLTGLSDLLSTTAPPYTGTKWEVGLYDASDTSAIGPVNCDDLADECSSDRWDSDTWWYLVEWEGYHG